MKFASSFNELYQQLRLRKTPFLVVFFVTVLVTYLFLYAVDFIPEPPAPLDEVDELETVVASDDSLKEEEVVAPAAPLPERLVIDKLNREVKVLNPEASDVATLDAALLKGVVRHPDSADFSNTGNIFILGHSSYLPNVLNKNFQALNGIQNLTWGDRIRVFSADTEYVYRVEKVYEAKASETVVPVAVDKARLTLATCDVYGAKEDRFMLEAELIETNPLAAVASR